MPQIEEKATVDSACVSTAPVFDEVAGMTDGARKKREPGWWALMEHNGDRDPGAHSGWGTTVAWAGWLALMFSFAFTSSLPWYLYVLSFSGLVMATVFLPDQGDSVLPYYAVISLPNLVFKGVAIGGWASYMYLLYIFVCIPILDWFCGMDVGNQSKAVQRELHGEFRFELLTLLVTPFMLGVIYYGAYLANSGTLSLFELTGLSIGVGMCMGILGFVVGHELCHRASWHERMCGRLLLCAAGYGHFYVEHTLGHHKWVATEGDPATARYGESLWAFLPRVVTGEFMSAWHLEAQRLKKNGLPWWQSEMPAYFLVTVAMAIAMAGLTGPLAFPYFAVQCATALLLFESVNYVEHYGLERAELQPGCYEPVQPKHSWDAPTRLTNHLLFKLQRHADHHAHAGKRYQTLQAYDSAPQMPSGYATMLVLALFPPVWRAVMHPRLLEYRKKQVGQRFRFGPTPEAEPAAEKTAAALEASGSRSRARKPQGEAE